MADDTREERRRAGAAKGRQCPWCGGRLELRSGYPRDQLVPGEPRAREDAGIPESFRTTRAWVCATPHCKYRESA